MTKTRKVLDEALRQCESHGSRLTDKRKQVLAVLLDSQKALSAYEIVDIYEGSYAEKLPPMSVYRILDFLQEENLVHKLNLANKFVACEHINCDHEHAVSQFLICSKCQKVKEVEISRSVISELKTNVKEAGFDLDSPQLEMNCICTICASKED